MITFIRGKLSQQYCLPIYFGGAKNVLHYNFKALKQCRSKVSRLPKFYRELAQLWSEVGERKCSNASKICGEVLWNNALIVSNGEALYN